MRSKEDLIILAIVLEGEPLTLSDIARKSGLSPQAVAYWLPRMVAKGTLLRADGGSGTVKYQPQPILLCDWIQEILGELYTECVERAPEFFRFDQASVDVAEVVRSNIAQSLRLFCGVVSRLSK